MDTLDNTNWLLTVLVFTPLAGALIMALVPEKEEETHKSMALLRSEEHTSELQSH